MPVLSHMYLIFVDFFETHEFFSEYIAKNVSVAIYSNVMLHHLARTAVTIDWTKLEQVPINFIELVGLYTPT